MYECNGRRSSVNTDCCDAELRLSAIAKFLVVARRRTSRVPVYNLPRWCHDCVHV